MPSTDPALDCYCRLPVVLLAWVNALQLGRRDLALVLANRKSKISLPGLFDLVSCATESNGAETIGGFSCLFAEMPHLCVFQTEKVGKWGTL